VVRDEGGTHVYIAERTDSATVARKRTITVGAESGAQVVVASGLQAGDAVVIVGQSDLSPGQPLDVTDQYDRIRAAGTPYRSDGDAAPPAS